MTYDANHNGTDRVDDQAATHDGRGARRWRRPAARGRKPRRWAGWESGLEGLEARALLSLIPTSISVSAASATLRQGDSETLTAMVTTPAGDPPPNFSDSLVSFYDGATFLGAGTVAGGSTATFTTTALAPGLHSITATYSGDSAFAASASGVEPASVQSVVPATGVSSPGGVAVDGAGDLFIADSGHNQVVEVTPGGTQTTVASGLNGPQGVAVDGSGDLFIADLVNNRVVEVKAGGAQTTVASGLNLPNGVAVDGSGNVFIADFNNNRVVEVNTFGIQTTAGSGLYGPKGVSVDRSGDVFIVDAYHSRVVEVTPGVLVIVNPDPTSISVSASASPVYGQSETFTATVTTLGGAAPTATDGTVSFYDGTTLLGTATLSGSPATATWTTTALALGPHTITARYSGDNKFVASASGVQPASGQSIVPGSGLSFPYRRGGGRVGRRLHRRHLQQPGGGGAGRHPDHRRFRAQSPPGRGGGRIGRPLHRRLRQ